MTKSVSILCAGLLLLGGCATAPKTTTSNFSGPASVPPKDRVLWQYRTALSAMRRGDFAQARTLLDDAILTISNIYGKDKSAKQSRGYFREEAKKNFLGEPYERVMAYVYRGILYWMDGEPDNARACFRSAQLIDADTENKTYASDYATLEYLDGLATFKLGGDGSDAYKRAQGFSKIGGLPPYDKDANVLVFFEFGSGPGKFATGQYSEQLRFRPGNSVVHGAWLRVANKAVRIGPYDDLNFQASTRGGRVMDHVLANKAVFKSGVDTFGNAAIIGGAVAASQRGGGEVGLALLAAGLIGKMVAASTTPAADTRAWDNLPQYISFAALQLPPGTYNGSVDFTDASGNVLSTKNFTFSTPADGRDAVLFLSDKNS